MRTVRNGKKVTPYCDECGCRLKIEDGKAYHFLGKLAINDVTLTATIVEDARRHACSKVSVLYILSDNLSI